jgi:hypothetical protein
MNSIHRVGLTVAGLVTALVVAGVLAFDGYASAVASQNQATPDPATQTAADSPSDGSLAPTIIYVLPAPTPTATSTLDPAVDGGLPQSDATIPPASASTQTPTRTPRPAGGGDD